MAVLAIGMAGCCASGPQVIDRMAAAAGLSRSVVDGTTFHHVVYSSASASVSESISSLPSLRSAGAGRGEGFSSFIPAHTLLVFLDGDGRPWSSDGRRPREDPTTRNPLALKLLTQTSAPGIYISRPCYQRIVDAGCSTDAWTSGRYSPQVVASIAAAARDAAKAGGFERIVLIGYSGGGVLAVLAAERLDNVAAVVTLAANLDTDAWTAYHGYLPLTKSLNPAKSERAHAWPEIHLIGAQDEVVPMATRAAYFAKRPEAMQWPYAKFDHVCCWAEQWREVMRRVVEELSARQSRAITSF